MPIIPHSGGHSKQLRAIKVRDGRKGLTCLRRAAGVREDGKRGKMENTTKVFGFFGGGFASVVAPGSQLCTCFFVGDIVKTGQDRKIEGKTWTRGGTTEGKSQKLG